MSTWMTGAMPEVGRHVQILNPVTDEVITGYCLEYLSDQWVLAEQFDQYAPCFVVHKNWKWRYI